MKKTKGSTIPQCPLNTTLCEREDKGFDRGFDTAKVHFSAKLNSIHDWLEALSKEFDNFNKNGYEPESIAQMDTFINQCHKDISTLEKEIDSTKPIKQEHKG